MITALDLQSRFETTIRSKDKVSGKSFQTSDMEEFFNQAQTEWLKSMIASFDSDERSKQLLAPVTQQYSTPFSAKSQSDGFYWDSYSTPEDLYAIVMEAALVKTDTRILIKPVTYDEYLQNVGNPYRRPHAKLAWRLTSDHGSIIVSTYPDITAYEIEYVKKPTVIDIKNNSEFIFEEEAMNTIVDAAVALALKSIELEQVTTKELHSENV